MASRLTAVEPGSPLAEWAENLDFVLSQFTAAECNDATDGLARDLDVGMTTTSELMAAFLNDLNNERLPDGVLGR